MIQNPVLTGFHADPCMICVEGIFYVANSTFEYYPGVKISQSNDLANWETVCYPLLDQKHIQMKGNPKSAGIWAPCLTYHDGTFYLVYTDVKHWAVHPFKDAPNYITTTKDLRGEWSKPVYINSSGFDPSLFHDDDGRKYFVNMEWDYRAQTGQNFTGILLTELDPVSLLPISKPIKIYKGTDRAMVEGPHLYKKDGWYYLLVAEGGTQYNHAATVARSRNIAGPYETHPQKHLITTAHAPQSPLQKTGHASLCQHPDGRWWLAYLCGRPVNDTKRCTLGRETGVAEIVWENGWPYLATGGMVPPFTFKGYEEKCEYLGGTVDFANKKDMLEFQSLRVPATYELLPDKGLRLFGKESLFSVHEQNMLVRRQDVRKFIVTVRVRFCSSSFQEMAGLIYRYDETNQHYLRIAYDETKECMSVGVLSVDNGAFAMLPREQEIQVSTGNDVWLRIEANETTCCFACSQDGEHFQTLPVTADVTKLSDDYTQPLGFTGAFIGLLNIDMNAHKSYADYYDFSYVRMERAGNR